MKTKKRCTAIDGTIDHQPNPGRIVNGGGACVSCGGLVPDSPANMERYKCTAEEIIYHEWEVEANSIEEAHEIAGEGCYMDCETKGGAHFGNIKIVKVA